MNTKNFKLVKLINVFDVYPGFLLPVFFNNNYYFFQNIEDDIITSFSVAELDDFMECKEIILEEEKYFKSGDRAVYSIIFPDNYYILGDKNKIIEYYNANYLYRKYKEFDAQMEEFTKQRTTDMVCLTKKAEPTFYYSNTENIKKLFGKQMMQNRYYRKKNISFYTSPKPQFSKSIPLFFSSETSNNYIILKNKGVYFCFNKEAPTCETSSIFSFYQALSEGYFYSQNTIIKYNYSSDICLKDQVRFVEYLLNNNPNVIKPYIDLNPLKYELLLTLDYIIMDNGFDLKEGSFDNLKVFRKKDIKDFSKTILTRKQQNAYRFLADLLLYNNVLPNPIEFFEIKSICKLLYEESKELYQTTSFVYYLTINKIRDCHNWYSIYANEIYSTNEIFTVIKHKTSNQDLYNFALNLRYSEKDKIVIFLDSDYLDYNVDIDYLHNQLQKKNISFYIIPKNKPVLI